MKRAALVALASVAACGGSSGSDGYDYGSEGARLWTEQCAVCHGEVGGGGLGPALIDTAMGEAELASIIDTRMPTSDPARCQGDCAEKVAAFIAEGLTSEALSCEERRAPSPRRLRLLTRFEYDNTIRDLFGDSGAGDDCRNSFAWNSAGRSAQSVHIAGSFNNWAATISEGGWALSENGGTWSGSFTLTPGHHTYKIVIDESDWLTDAGNPASEPDGFGGANSVVDITCSGELTAGFPAEVRPDGFAFETHADAAVVTATHLEAYLGAAKSIAAGAAVGLDAQTVVDELAPRIFRRSLDSIERARYLGLATTESPAAALEAMLVSPHFLYRAELGEPSGKVGRYDTFRLTENELASAMSYMFWGTAPDAELLEAASRGELRDRDKREAQARRLLADSRSREMVGRFAIQWLGGESIETAVKGSGFAALTSPLRAAMVEETRRFAAHVVFDSSGRFDELLTANYTIASPELARFYGLDAAGGDVVSYRGDRAGVLGHGSVLGTYAHSDQTSPIRRGLFVRQRLLCQELPPPPPFAGGVPEVDPDATTRERFAQHTDNEVCAGCHRYIDDLGFAFEHFDAIGQYRASESGAAIDASGSLTGHERLGATDEHPFASLSELARLLADGDAARSCFVRQAVRFSRGYRETLEDRCTRLDLEGQFEEAGSDVRELMISIVLSQDFEVRQ